MGKAPHRETLDALKWGGQGDRKGTWKKVAEAAGWLSFCWAKDKGNPAPPGVRAWEVLMNGSGGRGSRVWEAKASPGKGWGDRVVQGLQLWDRGGSYVTRVRR